jgi:hypothetical protein
MQSKKKRRGDTGRPWRIEYFKRHRIDDPAQAEPGRAFLKALPDGIRARFVAVLQAVSAAPPPAFSGGGYWEAMHDDMAGYYEVRVDGDPGRTHYRLFCLLERDGIAVGLDGPSLIVIAGLTKPFRTVLRAEDYATVRALGKEFLSRRPRSVVR